MILPDKKVAYGISLAMSDRSTLGEVVLATFANIPEAFMDAVDIANDNKDPRSAKFITTEWLACACLAVLDYKPEKRHQQEGRYGKLSNEQKSTMGWKLSALQYALQNYGGDWVNDFMTFLGKRSGVRLVDLDEVKSFFKEHGVDVTFNERIRRDVPSTVVEDSGSW